MLKTKDGQSELIGASGPLRAARPFFTERAVS